MTITTTRSGLITTSALSSGVIPGIDIGGRAPGQTLRLTCATSAASVTGYQTGTANTGTSSTSVAKPAGGTNWVANALRGKFLLCRSELRPIKSNTTTTLAVEAITGMTSGDTFSIVDLATTLDQISGGDLIALRLSGNLGPVEVVGVDFSAAHTLDGLVEILDCADVRLLSCRFAQNLANPAVSITRCGRVRVDHCLLESSADIEITRCNNVSSTGCFNNAGGVISIEDPNFVDVTKLTAIDAPSRVLSVVNAAGVVNVEADCNDGGASPLYFSGCNRMFAVGGLLTGTGNTGYGAEFASSGHYVVTGSTIDGTTNAMLFDATPSGYGGSDYLGVNYGAMATATMSLVAQTTVTKVAWFNNVLFDGSIDKSAREIAYGVNNPSNATINAAGTTVSDATQIVQQTFIVVAVCASGAGVKLHNVSVLPGVALEIYNGAANACLVYPSNGGTINGGASVSVAVGKVAMFRCVDWSTDKWIANVSVLG